MSNEKKNSKKVTITIRLPEWKWKKWKVKAEKDGISLNAFCIFAGDEYLEPIRQPIGFNPELDQVNQKIDSLQKSWNDLESQQKSVLDQTTQIPIDAKIQERIQNYLKKVKIPVSEYTIADEIGEDVDIVFVVCSYLAKINEVLLNKDLKWEVVPK